MTTPFNSSDNTTFLDIHIYTTVCEHKFKHIECMHNFSRPDLINKHCLLERANICWTILLWYNYFMQEYFLAWQFPMDKMYTVLLLWMNANILLVCYLSFHWMLFFAYFSVWFGVSRDARPVEAFFNSNTCIIWNALTELSALTLISVFNFLYIYLSSLSTYIPHASFCM